MNWRSSHFRFGGEINKTLQARNEHEMKTKTEKVSRFVFVSRAAEAKLTLTVNFIH
jgi:hypothetical protein